MWSQPVLSTLVVVVSDLFSILKLSFRSRTALLAENLFLRKQLAFYEEHKIRPRLLTDATRLTLVLWARWFNWKDALIIVKPETLIGWHRKGFRLFWRWKSSREDLDCRRTSEGLLCAWCARTRRGARRVADELSLKLGFLYRRARCGSTGPGSPTMGTRIESLPSAGERLCGITLMPSSPVIS